MDLGLVAQFVVSASSLDELFLEVKDSSLTDFVDDQEIVILGLSLKLSCSVDVGFTLNWILVFKIKSEQK